MARSVLMKCRACDREQPVEAFSGKQLRVIARQPGRQPLCLECARQWKSEERVRLEAVEVDASSGWVVDGRAATIKSRRGLQQKLSHVQSEDDRETETVPTHADVSETPRQSFFLHVSDPHALPAGVRYFPAFLSEDDEVRIMEIIDSRCWSTVFRRRQQFYGEVYYHTSGAVAAVQPVIAAGGKDETSTSDFTRVAAPTHDITCFDWLAARFFGARFYGRHSIFGNDQSNFPTQILVNEYLGNNGIASHFEDEEAFGAVIATVSLLAPIYMTLEKPNERTNSCDEILISSKLLLERRSLMIMSGESRYEFRHCITRHMDVHMPSGEVVKRHPSYRRVSLTIRHLLPGRRQVSVPSAAGDEEAA